MSLDDLFGDEAPPVARPIEQEEFDPATGIAIEDRTVFDPFNGEVVEATDVDGLAALYEKMRSVESKIRACKDGIRQAVMALSEGDTKTRRVRGRNVTIKLTMPDDNWDQSILKEAYHSFPQFRDEFLRIAKVDPKLREVKKLASTASEDPAFTTFRDMVTRANRGPTGLPTISVEQGK